jgi:hypothetical protein
VDPVDYKARGHNLVRDVPEVLDPYMPAPLADISTQRDVLSIAQGQNVREQNERLSRAERNKTPGIELDYSQYMPSVAAATGIAEASSLHRGEGPIDYAKLAETLTKTPFQVNVSVGGDKLVSVLTKAQKSQAARMSTMNEYHNGDG